MCGSCIRGDLNSHRPWTTMGQSFMQFSIVSIEGKLLTGNLSLLNDWVAVRFHHVLLPA